jgi:tetratricopeptide (TPR) repeat protein
MRNLMFVLAAGVAFGIASPAFAAGEEPSTTTETSSPKKLKCKQGEVVKNVKKDGKTTPTCVKAESSLLDDEELYQQGRLLAKEGEYDWALGVLAQIENQNDPRVLNYTGYSHRKAGRIELGITYYRKALAINPDFVLAREYLGEGYVAAGLFDLARAELSEIGKRCGTQCEEYKDLEQAIQTAAN